MTYFSVSGAKLQGILLEKQWSVRDLARAADLSETVSRQAVSDSEGRRFRPRTVFAMAGALGVDTTAFASVEG